MIGLPHYLVLAVFVGGGVWVATSPRSAAWWDQWWAAGGLVGPLPQH